jgi:fumarate reductase subunit C
MNGNRPDKSKLYYPKMSAIWWLKKKSYFMFMMRELSCVFIAIFLVVFLIQIYQLNHGYDAYVAFRQKLGSPGWILFHVAALIFALYHSMTWFYSTAVVVQFGRIRRELIIGLNIGAWIVLSLLILVLFIALRS